MKRVRARKPYKGKTFFTHSAAVSKKAPGHVKRAQRDLEREIEREIEREMAVMSIAMPFLLKDQIRGIVQGKLGLEAGKHLLRKGGGRIDYGKISLDFPKSPEERATRLESPRNIRKKLLGRSQPFSIIRQNSAVRKKQQQKGTNGAFGFDQASPIDQAPTPFVRKTPRPPKRQTKKSKRRLFTLSDDNDDIFLEDIDDFAPVNRPPTKSLRRNICHSTPEKHTKENKPTHRNQTARIQPTVKETLPETLHFVDSDSEDQIVGAGGLSYIRSDDGSEDSSKLQSRRDGTPAETSNKDLLMEDNPSPVLNVKSDKGLQRGRIGCATKSTRNNHRESNHKDLLTEQEPGRRHFAYNSSDDCEDPSNLPPRKDGTPAETNNKDSLVDDNPSPVLNGKSDKGLRRGRIGCATKSTRNNHSESNNKDLLIEQEPETRHLADSDSDDQTVDAGRLSYSRSDDDSEDSSKLPSRRDGTPAVSNNEDWLMEDNPSPVLNVKYDDKCLRRNRLGRATKSTSNEHRESNGLNKENPILEKIRRRRARLSLTNRSKGTADKTAEDQTNIGISKSPTPASVIMPVPDQSSTILEVLGPPKDMLMDAAVLPNTPTRAARNRITPPIGGNTRSGFEGETLSEACHSRIAYVECDGLEKIFGRYLSKDKHSGTPQSTLIATAGLTQHGESSSISLSRTLWRHKGAVKHNSPNETLMTSTSFGSLKLLVNEDSPVSLGMSSRNSALFISSGSVDMGQNYGSMQSAQAATLRKESSPRSLPCPQPVFTVRDQSKAVVEELHSPEEIGEAVIPATPSDAACTNISSPLVLNVHSGLVSDTPSEASGTRINAECDGPQKFPGSSHSKDVHSRKPQSTVTANLSAHQANPFNSASRTQWHNLWAGFEKDSTKGNTMVNSFSQGELALQQKNNSTTANFERSAGSSERVSSDGSSVNRCHDCSTPGSARTVRPVGGSFPCFTTSTPNLVSFKTGEPSSGNSVEMYDNSLRIQVRETSRTDVRSMTTQGKSAFQILSPPHSAWNRDHPAENAANRSSASGSSNDMFTRSGYSLHRSNPKEKTNNALRSGDDFAAISVGKQTDYSSPMSTKSATSRASSPLGSLRSTASSVRLPQYPAWKSRSSEEDAGFNSPERNSSAEISSSSYRFSSSGDQQLRSSWAEYTPTSMRPCRGWSAKKGIPRVGQVPNQEITARRMLFQGEDFPTHLDHSQEKDAEESAESQSLILSPDRRLSDNETNHLKDFSAAAPHKQVSNQGMTARRMLIQGKDFPTHLGHSQEIDAEESAESQSLLSSPGRCLSDNETNHSNDFSAAASHNQVSNQEITACLMVSQAFPTSLDPSQDKDEELAETQILFSSPKRVLGHGKNNLKDFSTAETHRHISVVPLLLKKEANRLDGLPFPSDEAVRTFSAEWMHQKKLVSDSPRPTTPRKSSEKDTNIWRATTALLVVKKRNSQQSQQNSYPLLPEDALDLNVDTRLASFTEKKSAPEEEQWWTEDSVMRALSQLGVEDVANTETGWETQLVVSPSGESVQRSMSSRVSLESSVHGRSWLSSRPESSVQSERLLSSQESVFRALE